MGLSTPSPARTRVLWSAAVVAAWLVLVGTSAAPVPMRAGELALCLASGVAAAACWARVALVREERAVWALFAGGLSAYALGWQVLFLVSMGEGGGPLGLNVSDCVSLCFYPLCLAAVLLRTRRLVDGRDWRALLDGGVVALAAAGASVAAAGGLFPELFAESWLDAVYATAYPIGTVVLLVTVLTGLVVTRFHLDRAWALLVLAFAGMATGQSLYAVRTADGVFGFGTWLDPVYLLGPLLVALAAWSPPTAEVEPEDTSGSSRTVMGLTAAGTVLALAVLVVSDVSRDVDPPLLAVLLATCAVLGAVLRTALFVRQDQLLAIRTEQALTDLLTGLQNRRALLAHLARCGASGEPYSLLLVDLDRFKAVNDSLGHGAGDDLLVEVAARLVEVTPPGGTTARLGGDEFAVVLPDGLTEAYELARRLRAAVGSTVLLDGHHVAVGASVGLVDADPGLDPEELLRRADVALYRAKSTARGVEVWTPEIDAAARGLLTLVADLRDALSRGGELVVHLQPQCEPGSGQVRALEALVRWEHPQRGLLMPADFLPAAERAGLLPALTTVVLDLAMRDAAVLRTHGRDLPVSVNVGADDLVDPRFASRVAQVLARHGLPPRLLRLEVTETVVMRDPERVVRTLTMLAGTGVGLSLDDYGTGLASLSYLRRLPIDELKIDRAFVTPYLGDDASRLITRSTLELAHGLGLTVVAEGVEDLATREALARAGCDLVQGWECGRPAPLAELLPRLLPGGRGLPAVPAQAVVGPPVLVDAQTVADLAPTAPSAPPVPVES